MSKFPIVPSSNFTTKATEFSFYQRETKQFLNESDPNYEAQQRIAEVTDEMARRNNPGYVAGMRLRGMFYGNPEKTQKRRNLSQQPDFANSTIALIENDKAGVDNYVNLAKFYQEQNTPESDKKVEAYLNDALTKFKGYNGPLLKVYKAKIEYDHSRRKWRRMKSDLTQAEKIAPQDTDIILKKAVFLQETYKSKEALKLFGEARLQLAKEEGENFLLNKSYFDDFLFEARAAFKMKNHKLVVKICNELLKAGVSENIALLQLKATSQNFLGAHEDALATLKDVPDSYRSADISYQKGLASKALGLQEDAEKYYNEAIGFANGHVAASYELVGMTLSAKKYDKTLYYLNEMFKEHPLKKEPAEFYSNLVAKKLAAILEENQYQTVLDISDILLEANPKSPLAKLAKQQALFHMGEQLTDREHFTSHFKNITRNARDPVKVQKASENLIVLEPDEPQHLITLGKSLLDQQKFIEAQNVTQKALELAPGNIQARFQFSHNKYCLGDYRNAKVELLTIAGNPLLKTSQNIESNNDLADIAAQEGDYATARKYYLESLNLLSVKNREVKSFAFIREIKKKIAAFPADLEEKEVLQSRIKDVELRIDNKAGKYNLVKDVSRKIKNKNYIQAEKNAEKILALDANDLDGLLLMGKSLVGQGGEDQKKYSEALGYLDQVIEKNPENLEARYSRAAAYKGIGNYNKAKEELSDYIIPQSKSELRAQKELYDLAILQEEYKEAYRWQEGIIKIFHENPVIHKQSSTAETLKDFVAAIESISNKGGHNIMAPMLDNLYGLIKEKNKRFYGRHKLKLANLKASLGQTLLTNDEVIEIAQSYEAQGDFAKAIDTYNNYLISYPNDSKVLYSCGLANSKLTPPNNDMAISNFLKIDLSDENYAEAQYLISTFLKSSTKYRDEDPILYVQKAISSNPKHIMANHAMAKSFRSRNETIASHEYYEKFLDSLVERFSPQIPYYHVKQFHPLILGLERVIKEARDLGNDDRVIKMVSGLNAISYNKERTDIMREEVLISQGKPYVNKKAYEEILVRKIDKAIEQKNQKVLMKCFRDLAKFDPIAFSKRYNYNEIRSSEYAALYVDSAFKSLTTIISNPEQVSKDDRKYCLSKIQYDLYQKAENKGRDSVNCDIILEILDDQFKSGNSTILTTGGLLALSYKHHDQAQPYIDKIIATDQSLYTLQRVGKFYQKYDQKEKELQMLQEVKINFSNNSSSFKEYDKDAITSRIKELNMELNPEPGILTAIWNYFSPPQPKPEKPTSKHLATENKKGNDTDLTRV